MDFPTVSISERTHLQIFRAEQPSRTNDMARLMNLLQVVRFREVGIKELRQQRLSKIQELVLLVILRDIRLVRLEVFGWDPFLINNPSVSPQPPNKELVQHAICGVGVVVLGGILHDFTDVLPGMLEDEVVTSRMILEELGHIIDLSIASDPTTFGSRVFLDVLCGEDAEPFSERH